MMNPSKRSRAVVNSPLKNDVMPHAHVKACATLDRVSGAASVRVTRKYKPLQRHALCATIGYLSLGGVCYGPA